MTMPSGMQRRTCDRASEAFGDLDAASVEWATFGEGYQRSLTSSADVFMGHLNPGVDTVEFAMQGQTTSWIAMGIRSVGCAPLALDARHTMIENLCPCCELLCPSQWSCARRMLSIHVRKQNSVYFVQ